jgi:uncharacterized membrane protein
VSLDVKTIWPVVAALFVGAGGASSFFITRSEADCRAAEAACAVRVELTAAALVQCSAALDTITGGPREPAP